MFYVIVTAIGITSTSVQLQQGYRTPQECQAEIVRNTVRRFVPDTNVAFSFTCERRWHPTSKGPPSHARACLAPRHRETNCVPLAKIIAVARGGFWPFSDLTG
jgi:hypothetical protein